MFLTHKAVVRLFIERVPRLPAHSPTGQVKPGTLPVGRFLATAVPSKARGASARPEGRQSCRRSRPLPAVWIRRGWEITKTGQCLANVSFRWAVSRSGDG